MKAYRPWQVAQLESHQPRGDLCSFPGCDRVRAVQKKRQKVYPHKWCWAHHKQRERNGADGMKPLRVAVLKNAPCAVAGCEKQHYRRSRYCTTHLWARRKLRGAT